jgi:DNA-binding transcriptional LysR family regulator
MNLTDESGKAEAIRLSGRVFADSGDALLALARKDGGVVLGPHYLVGEDVQAGRLVRPLPGYVTPDTPVFAVYPPPIIFRPRPGHSSSSTLRAFAADHTGSGQWHRR